jgi:hypothetical protein
MRRGKASQRGTAQLEFTSRQTVNVHLPAPKSYSAKNAHPPLAERTPAPAGIAYAQDREPISEIDLSDHNAKRLCSLH